MEQIILEALFMVLSIVLSGFWFVLNAVMIMEL